MMLKEGDPCYVRLISGEIVKARFDYTTDDGESFVYLESGGRALAGKKLTEDKTAGIVDCRFVVMSGMRKEYVEAIK